MVDEKVWLTVSAPIHSNKVELEQIGSSQDSVQDSQFLPCQTHLSRSLWTLLCALVCSHVGIGWDLPFGSMNLSN